MLSACVRRASTPSRWRCQSNASRRTTGEPGHIVAHRSVASGSSAIVPASRPHLQGAIHAERPDVLLIDEGAWGGAAVAERSGIPRAYTIVSPVPLPSRDAPPFGLGLRPRDDAFGGCAMPPSGQSLGALERLIARKMNPLRADLGLPRVRTIADVYLAADVVLAFTAEPFDTCVYWPSRSPPGWDRREPPAERPDWLDRLSDPWSW